MLLPHTKTVASTEREGAEMRSHVRSAPNRLSLHQSETNHPGIIGRQIWEASTPHLMPRVGTHCRGIPTSVAATGHTRCLASRSRYFMSRAPEVRTPVAPVSWLLQQAGDRPWQFLYMDLGREGGM